MKDYSKLSLIFIFLCICMCYSKGVNSSDLKKSDLTLNNKPRQTETLKINVDGDKIALKNKKPFRDSSSNSLEKLGDIPSDSNPSPEDLYDEWDWNEVRDYKFRKPDFLFNPHAMRKLVGIEGNIYQEMKQYLRNMEGKIRMFRNYIRDYEESALTLKDGMEDLVQQEYNAVANPIVSYRMMRRFAVDIPAISNSFNFDFQKEFVDAMVEINDEMIYPNKSDYNEALYSIIKIQRYTTLDPYELSEGKLGHLQTSSSLLPIHLFEIGMEAKIHKRFAMAIEWFEVALYKLDKHFTADDEILRQRIEIELRQVVETHDKRWKRNNHKNDNYFSKRIGDNYGNRKVPRVKTYDIKRNQSIGTRNETKFSSHMSKNFASLCSGQNFQSESEKARLYCYYETTKHPYLRINPMKMELLHETPRLLQIYDFMGPQAINNLIQAATPRLERSEVLDDDDPEGSLLSEVRTSSQTWLKETSHPVLQWAEKNIETLTGLRVKSDKCSETFQIANYGTSHHYDEHLDVLEDERRIAENGDRIVTFMIYLSDVEVGGKTAFPILGTAANPVAGSAVMWHNLHRNGKPDYRTWHGGCPVVHGIKWVANKWILSKCNWRSEPCTLNKDE